MNIYIAYTLASQVIWGLLPLFWILLNQVAPLYTLSTRIVWAALFCFLLILQKHLLPGLKGVRATPQQWKFITGACILITINWGSFIYAVTQGFVLQASLAYFMNPIVVILFGSLFFHEKLSVLQRISIAFAAAGIGTAFFLYGQFPYLAITICMSWACYSMMKKKIRLDSQVSVFIESFSMVPLALLFIAYSEYMGIGAVGILHGWEWILLPLTGVVTAIPMMLFSAGVKGTPFGVSGICMYLSPTMTLIIGLMTGEALTTPLLVTFVCTWIAVALYLVGLFRIVRRLKAYEIDRK
jgi:chloramphenicol-sensitive protein RarD